MALVIQTEAATETYIPYERPPDNFALWSAIPRGLVSFLVDTQQLDLKPVNDTFLLNITGTLGGNFGYVMMDANLTLNQDRAADWEKFCNFGLQNYYRAPLNLSLGVSSNWVQDMVTFSGSTNLMAQTQAWPTFPIIGTPGSSGIQMTMSAFNATATAAAVGTMNFYASFWQFDLEQIRKFPINSPIPTHSR